MKSIIPLLAILLFATSTQAETEGQFSVEIRVANGYILGSIHNLTSNELKTFDTFGWWEFTTVLYHDGQRWHEAKLKKNNRAVRGMLRKISIKPKEPYSFSFPLSEYEFPEELTRVTKVRIVTSDLWSNIEDIKNSEQQLQPVAEKSNSDGVVAL